MTTFFFFNTFLAWSICSDSTSRSTIRRRWSDVDLDEPVENPFDAPKYEHKNHDDTLIDNAGMSLIFCFALNQIYGD